MSRILNRFSILLVEDNPDDIIITKRALQKGKVKNRLYIVHDGEEALHFLKRTGPYEDAPKPALILLDLKMPKVNGFEVLEEIKQDKDLKSIPIIMLTTSAREIDIEKAYQLGCNNYIIKPVSFENFIQTVIKMKEYWLNISRIPIS
jgi:CheY-like chemotaxis protein